MKEVALAGVGFVVVVAVVAAMATRDGGPASAWHYQTDGHVASAAAVAEGIVYVGSDDGSLHAIDARTGDGLWKLPTGGPIRTRPAVHRGIVVVKSDDGRLHAASATTGGMAWARPVGARVQTSLAAGEGFVFAADGAALIALDIATGREEWRFDHAAGFEVTPTYANGRVYAGAFDGTFFAIEAASGTVGWSLRFDSPISSEATVADGVVYVAVGRQLVAIDDSAGMVRWTSAAGDIVRAAPAAADGHVYVLASPGLKAFSAATGELLWSYQTDTFVNTAPLASQSLVIAGTFRRYVVAVDGTTGKLRWRYRTGGTVRATPVAAGGRIFVGSYDSRIHAIEVGEHE